MRCKNYERGTCRNGACGYAHEGEGHNYLIPFQKLHRERLGLEEPATMRSGAGGDDGNEEEDEGGVKLV
jgi:hypothetical protein